MADRMDPIEPGSRIGDLDVGRRIGGGAFGDVFLAKDRLIQRDVALKVVRLTRDDADPRERDRVLNEARLAGRLRSPHIATLFGVHVLEEDRGWVLEMEYLAGGSLEDLLRKPPRLPPGDVLRIVNGILRGLAAAHEADVVHGDVKPANVLFADDGTVKLVDFGLAHLVGEASLAASSAVGLVGTPVYMSPEVVMGARATALSDLWSTGVILYRALAGRLPFAVTNLPDLFHTIQNAEPQPLPPDLPSALADLTLRCLEKDPRGRPQSCREALAALEPTVIRRQPVTPVPRAVIPLVARTRERARLHHAAADAAKGCGQALVVSGESGVGKSFLIRELVDTTRARGFRWIETTVTGLEGLLRPLLNDVRRALREFSAPDSTASAFGSAADLLVQLLSEDSPVSLDSRQQTIWLLERALSGLAARQPLGLVLENAHLADEESHQLLLALAQRVVPHRVLILIEYATQDRDPADGCGVGVLTRSEHVAHLPLDRLTAENTARLLEAYAEGARLRSEVAEHVVRVSEGNPLFAIELFRHLQETNAIVREDNTLTPGPEWEAVPFPRRLKELVAPRLRALPEDQRSILDMAAVDGVRFDGEALAAASEMPLLKVLRALQDAYRRTGLVAPREQGWRFANTVFQEGLYQDLAPDLRRVLHRRFAEHLEERAQREPVDPERLGVHWERAGDKTRAAPHLNAAAHQATRRQECLRAIDLAKRSGLYPKGIDETTATEQAGLLFALSGCLCDLGRGEEAERLLDAVLGVADGILHLRALVWREDIRLHARGVAAVDEEELLRAARELPDSEELGRARYILGLAAKYKEDLGASQRWQEEADEVFVRLGKRSGHSSCLDQLAQIAARRGRFEEAEALHADASRVATECGRPTSAAASEVNRVCAAFARRAVPELEPVLDQAFRTFLLGGLPVHAAQAVFQLAGLRYDRGAVADAERAVEQGFATLGETEHPVGRTMGFRHRAHLDAVRGRLASALDHIGAALQAAKQAGKYSEAVAKGIETQLLCFAGRLKEAASAARQGLELAAGFPDKGTLEDLAMWFAEARLYGLPAAVLDETAALLEQGGATAKPAREAVAGARALDDGSQEDLDRGAAALRDPAVGGRRATLAAVADRLTAEALRRAGNDEEARAAARSMLARAERIGHVWLQMAAHRTLAGLDPAGRHKERLEKLVRSVAGGDERIEAAWISDPRDD
jgi:hypothetical protein